MVAIKWRQFYGCKIEIECNLPATVSTATLYNGYEAG
jgi:hypothetical protein